MPLASWEQGGSQKTLIFKNNFPRMEKIPCTFSPLQRLTKGAPCGGQGLQCFKTKESQGCQRKLLSRVLPEWATPQLSQTPHVPSNLWLLLSCPAFPDVGKDCRQEEKGTTEDKMVRWHHQLNGHGFRQTPGWTGRPGVLQFMGLQRVRHD